MGEEGGLSIINEKVKDVLKRKRLKCTESKGVGGIGLSVIWEKTTGGAKRKRLKSSE